MTTLSVAGTEVSPGGVESFEVPFARVVTGTWLSLPVTVANGLGDGATVWLSGAIHGDEVNGVEIIRRVLASLDPRRLTGTVIAVPVVNVFAFVSESRYLPDRRDLNRAFPGSARGSLAGQLAHLFMTEIATKCDYGIDLHTGSDDRSNAPQIRADLDDADTRECALAFGADFVIHAAYRDGSLREAAAKQGVRVLVYEGGEARRFSEPAIAAGVDGIWRLLAHLGMYGDGPPPRPSVVARKTRWVRARRSGILQPTVELGERLQAGDGIATISDVLGGARSTVRAPADGHIIGLSHTPLISRGEAVANIAVAPAYQDD